MKLLTPNSRIPLTAKVRRAVFLAFGQRCFYSGAKLAFEEAHIDHYIPRSQGGRDVAMNYVLCRADLNLRKHAAILPNTPATQDYLRGVTAPKIIRFLNLEILREVHRLIGSGPVHRSESIRGTTGPKRTGKLRGEQHSKLRQVFAKEEEYLILKAVGWLMDLQDGDSGVYELRSEHLEGELVISGFDRSLVLGVLNQITLSIENPQEWFSCNRQNASFPEVSVRLKWSDTRVTTGMNSSLVHELMATKRKNFIRISVGAITKCLLRNASLIRKEWGDALSDCSLQVRPITGEVTITHLLSHQVRYIPVERYWLPRGFQIPSDRPAEVSH